MSNLPDSSGRRIAVAAVVLLTTFPVVVVALNVVQRHHYHPSTQAISELALGRGGASMVVAFLALGSGIGLVDVLLHRAAPELRVLPAMLGVVALLAGPMSAFFHTDRTGAPESWHGAIHDGSGMTAFVTILLSMYVAALRLGRDPILRPVAVISRAWVVVATPAFFLIPVMSAHFGLAQRVYVAAFVGWFVVLALRLGRAASARVGRSEPFAPPPALRAR